MQSSFEKNHTSSLREIALLPYLRWLEDMRCSLEDVRTVVMAQDAGTFTSLSFGMVQYPG